MPLGYLLCGLGGGYKTEGIFQEQKQESSPIAF